MSQLNFLVEKYAIGCLDLYGRKYSDINGNKLKVVTIFFKKAGIVNGEIRSIGECYLTFPHL